jgi:hypothetical protein
MSVAFISGLTPFFLPVFFPPFVPSRLILGCPVRVRFDRAVHFEISKRFAL